MYIKVRATTGAKKERVEKQGSTYTISVKEKAERNLANRRIRQVLAETLGISERKLRLISGHHQPLKKYQIIGLQSM